MQRLLLFLLPPLVRILAWSWRIKQENWPVEGACVVAFWHGQQLPMIALHRSKGLTGVASLSKDGELLAGVLQKLGYGVIRGSSSRGGAGVLREGLKLLKSGGKLALAVDGPRGPAKTVQPGAELLATRCGVPVVFGVAEGTGIRLKSWDSFWIPLGTVQIRYGVWHPGTGTLQEAMLQLEQKKT
jgi:lysophospholipid acyltransferase (LPLAT)-like uncharacterized protein